MQKLYGLCLVIMESKNKTMRVESYTYLACIKNNV